MRRSLRGDDRRGCRMMVHRKASLSILGAALTVVACSPAHVASDPAANTISIDLRPGSVEIRPGDVGEFDAIVTGTANTAATWKVQEGSAGGAVTAAGVYTAPSAAGTYHVVATSVADPSKNDTATVNVTALVVTVSVTPSAATIQPGGSIAFSA